MIMTVLSNENLDNLCKSLRDYDDYYWYQTNDFLRDLYYTGCRSQELFKINRWSITDENTCQLIPFKSNNNRRFTSSLLSGNFIGSIMEQKKPYSGLTLRQLMFQVNRRNIYGQIFVDGKEMDAYIFRYNKVKLMVADGVAISDIQDFFGWTSSAMVFKYANAELYYI
jgi:hypothetical protein